MARWILAVAVLAGGLGLTAAGCSRPGGEAAAGGASAGEAGGPAAGDAALPRAAEAPLAIADVDGLHAELQARRRAGRAVLLNFWATWCVPCVEELPDLAKLSREFADRGVDFVGVSLDAWVTGNGDETERKVKAFLARTGVSYPNYIYQGDQDPLLSGFDLPGAIPYSALYDRGGRKVASWEGLVDPAELRRAITALP
jgi:thiol-disulfide isomerase/thioredoxin